MPARTVGIGFCWWALPAIKPVTQVAGLHEELEEDERIIWLMIVRIIYSIKTNATTNYRNYISAECWHG